MNPQTLAYPADMLSHGPRKLDNPEIAHGDQKH